MVIAVLRDKGVIRYDNGNNPLYVRMIHPGSHLLGYHLGHEVNGALLHLRDRPHLNLHMNNASAFSVDLYVQYAVLVVQGFLFNMRVNHNNTVILSLWYIQNGFKEFRQYI